MSASRRFIWYIDPDFELLKDQTCFKCVLAEHFVGTKRFDLIIKRQTIRHIILQCLTYEIDL